MYEAEQEEFQGLTIRLFYDEHAEDPRKMWDHQGELCGVADRGRCHWADETIPMDYYDSLEEWLKNNHESVPFAVWLPVRFDDYGSSARIWAGEPNEIPEDGTHNGVIVTYRRDILKEYGVQRISKRIREQVAANLKAEIEELDMYFRGEVYSYTIEDQDGEILDSCSGFYGYDYAMEEAREQAKYWAQNRADKHTLAMVAGL